MTFEGGNDKGQGEVNYSLPVDDRFHLMLKIHTTRDLDWELYREWDRNREQYHVKVFTLTVGME